jgi:DNA-cytosine methyltransferase
MSCGRIALERAGIKVNNYFASEIDKYSQIVSQNNYPDIIRLGDVREVNGKNLPEIDLLIGGSPCQSFSFAGKMNGMSTKENIETISLEQYLELKKNDFEFNGYSYLFWEYARLLKELKPKYFLLENVKMLKKWSDIISNTLGVEPIMINSSLVSAQSRKRLYWTNISDVGQPEDKNIFLQDILEDGIGVEYNRKEKERKEINKALTLCSSDWRGINRNQNQTAVRIYTLPHGYMRESIGEKDKYPSLCAQRPDTKHLIQNGKKWRRLSVLECERLQTLPENYTAGVSNTQRHKMIGNGWTVDVISHILTYLNKKEIL